LLRRCPMSFLDLLLLSGLGCHPSFSRTGHSRKTLANNTTIARGLIIFKSLSRDTAALHVYETHDRILSSGGGIGTSSRRVGAHGNCRTRVKTHAEEVESIVWSSSFLRMITSKIDSIIRPSQ